MEAYAIHKGAIIKPRLARMTMDLIRNKSVSAARGILETTNTKASTMILKVLNSAVANAVNNFGAKEDELVIKECFVNPGTILKRIQFASRGNVDRHDKRTSLIKVVVTDNKEEGSNE
jgi:large subunit ribosomal protein L22